MPSVSDNSSWHPAFMPNAVEVIIANKSTESSSTRRESKPIESFKAPSTPPPSDLHTRQALGEVQDGQEMVADNSGHPELSDLRNALTTSLASPGGVELDENPVHNGEADAREKTKADFPSEGPNKHSSTMSFARTVSGALDFGEDDEVDPEWNIHQMDTDPFQMMAQSNRTNSFPLVPPAHAQRITRDEPLPHSQAEDIMHEVELENEPQDLFGDSFHEEEDFFAQAIASQDSTNEFPPELKTSNDYGQAFGGELGEEEDQQSQARYEEGLPLFHSPENHVEHRPASSVSFMDDLGNEEDDFFAQVSKSDQPGKKLPEPPSIERKSTMQVMQSLNFQPNEPKQDKEGEVMEENMQNSQNSLDKATGGGIGVSTSTVLSQVFGDPDAAIHIQPENLAALEMDSGEGDLAEKWKAALAGDEFLDDEDDLLIDDDEPEKSSEKGLDPADIFGSDDEGFLEDAEDQSNMDFSQQTSPPVPAHFQGHVMGSDSLTGAVQANRPSSSSRYIPAGATNNAPVLLNTYAPLEPLLTDLSRPATTSGVPSPYGASTVSSFPPQYQTQPQPPRPDIPKAQSFSDKAKGGYSSPYDLPMDIVKPRKRVSAHQTDLGHNASALQANVPPPRTSSIPPQPSVPSNISAPSLSPPTSSHSQQSGIQTLPRPPKTIRKTQSGFFEELPMSAKPRPAVRHASSFVTPTMNSFTPPNSAPHQPPSGAGLSPYLQPTQQPIQLAPSIPGLVAPERVSPYASLPTGNFPVSPAASRYSPAPLQHNQTAPPPPVAQSRYSPAPPSQRQIPAAYNAPPINATAPVHAHQPRTSSPLAHFERSQDPRSYGSQAEIPGSERRTSSSYESNLKQSHLPPTREVDESEQLSNSTHNSSAQSPPSQPLHSMRLVSQISPPPRGIASRTSFSPPRRTASNFLPQQTSLSPPQTFLPPQRSQTQSPGTAFAGPRLEMSTSDPYQRPASVEVPSSPRAPPGFQSMAIASHSRPRGFSQGLNHIAPTDGREHDPLQRWKGSPVFAWGVGGTLITSFPKDVPRYGMGQTAPMIIRSPGEVKIRNIKEVDPLSERLTSFPGPLKGKAKKKEVATWLTSGIQILEQDTSYLRSISSFSHEDKRREERLLLWKILRTFIEHDGFLEGNAAVDKAVRDILSPDLEDVSSSAAPLYATGADLSGISPSASGTRSDPVDPTAVDQLRKHLLRGEREKAVWEAVDKRLWAHAMLISNTVSKELYKQVAQEFVQKEVKYIGHNTESLAALYEIFAGNFEESIDELVPPSARAGFQMVSTSNNSGPSKDALDGLDRWRETLGLVLSNRSTDDSQALNALGKLLSGYGRAEAAHICFLFARTHTVFGGIDDPLTNVVLIGADHLRQPYEFDKEIEPILLSEVFEYGMSLSSVSNVTISSPHLSVYKLQHAKILAEYGYRDKALQYCEAIAVSINSQTRRSPYHHALLVTALDDLNMRLKQSPKDENGSWISKPSIDKVSGSVWATFNKFVAGDGDDSAAAGSNALNGAEAGPFARIAGGTPTISRSPSQSDIYGSYPSGSSMNGSIPIPVTKTSSRYAPGGGYTPNEPQPGSYGSQPRTSLEGRSSSEHRGYEPQRQMSDYRPNSQPSNTYAPQSATSYTSQSAYPSYPGADSPYAETTSSYGPQLSTPVTEQPPSDVFSSPQPLNKFDSPQQPNSYTPSEPSSRQASSGYEPTYEHPSSNVYNPASSNGYEPPTSSSYEPPSYEPAAISDEPDSPISTRPKKSPIDDEDDMKSAPASGKMTKAEKDRDADEAFRKAAEADAAKSSSAPAKKGWGLSGWFGGAKKEPDMNQPNKPIRAKLGEASSFVYDPDLKRWINKKGGATVPSHSDTPPPPKMGPPRTMSGPPTAIGAPTSTPRPATGPPQRAVSEMTTPSPLAQSDGMDGGLAPPMMQRSVSNGSLGPFGSSGQSSAPNSRPGTGMSNASSIDDLLGPPTARKGAKAKKKGRGYIDVMGVKATTS